MEIEHAVALLVLCHPRLVCLRFSTHDGDGTGVGPTNTIFLLSSNKSFLTVIASPSAFPAIISAACASPSPPPPSSSSSSSSSSFPTTRILHTLTLLSSPALYTTMLRPST